MNYESTNGAFPAQTLAPSVNSVAAASEVPMSWIPPILQYTEQGPMYNAMNFNLDMMSTGVGGWANSTASCSNLSTLMCPSESMWQPLRQWGTGTDGAIHYYGMTNYRGNYGGPGVIQVATGTIVPSNFGVKATRYNLDLYVGASWGPVTIASITDGTSNTGMISEGLIGVTNSNFTASSSLAKRAPFSGPVAVGLNAGQAGALQFVQGCKAIPGTQGVRYGGGGGQMWVASLPTWLIISSYTHFGAPNSLPCTNNSADVGTKDAGGTFAGYYVGAMGSAPPTSNHPGGVNVAFSDGSVHFIKDSVNLQTWWGLGSRNLGEVISSDGY